MALSDKLKEGWSKTKDVAGEAFDKGKELAGTAAEKTKEVAGTVVEKGKEVTHRGEAKPDETPPPPVDDSAGSE